VPCGSCSASEGQWHRDYQGFRSGKREGQQDRRKEEGKETCKTARIGHERKERAKRKRERERAVGTA